MARPDLAHGGGALPPGAVPEPSFVPEPKGTLRLFAGVWPSQEVAASLAALPRPAVPGVRWTAAGQWHVTLAFLGAVAEPAVDALGAALRQELAAWAGPVDAHLGPATERLGRSVLCVPVAGLDALAAATRAVLSVPPASIPFRGHLTVARARRHHTIPTSLAGTPIVGRWKVRAVCLVRSQLDPAGARYATLVDAKLPLPGRPAGNEGIQHRTGVRH